MKRLILVGVVVLCAPSIVPAQAQIVPSNGINGGEKTDVEGWCRSVPSSPPA